MPPQHSFFGGSRPTTTDDISWSNSSPSDQDPYRHMNRFILEMFPLSLSAALDATTPTPADQARLCAIIEYRALTPAQREAFFDEYERQKYDADLELWHTERIEYTATAVIL